VLGMDEAGRMTFRLAAQLEGHRAHVFGCCWSPDGKYAVTCSMDGSGRVWEVVDGSGPPRQCAQLEVQERATGPADVAALPTLLRPPVLVCCAWSPCGRWLAAGSTDGVIRMWDARRAFAPVCTTAFGRDEGGHGDCVKSVAWSPDGKRLASGSDDHTVRVWDMHAGEGRLEPAGVLEGHAKWVEAVAWSPDGRRLASGSDDFAVRIWEQPVGDGVLGGGQGGGGGGGERERGGEGRADGGDADGPNGGRTGTPTPGGNGNPTPVPNDEALGWRCVQVLTGHTAFVMALSWSVDGTQLVSGGFDRALRVWDMSGELSPRRAQAGEGPAPERFALKLDEIHHEGSLYAIASSPDGRLLATGSRDKCIRIFDTSTPWPWTIVDVRTNHPAPIGCLAWRPGQPPGAPEVLMSGDYHGHAVLWTTQ